MPTNNPSLQFFLNLARIQAVMARRFDSGLGGGLGFNDFVMVVVKWRQFYQIRLDISASEAA